MSRNSDIVALLAKKRRGKELTDSEIDDFVMMTVKNAIDGSQIGAMLMAIAIRGLSKQETASLTKSMAHSGHVFKWDFEVCDKHSTGGVGDKISIPLAPALAALGVKVPMLSGRGLDLTGGTLDKLESIPGFRVNLSIEELTACINECGVFIASPTNNLCTADKVLYSFRDVTATADCDGLIVGSILSKKAATGVKHMVLDIKIGEVSQHSTIEEASAFAYKMKDNANLLGMNLVCVLTEMDNPIGQYAGNSLEIEESILTLRGKGTKDINELIEVLGGKLMSMSGKAKNDEEGQRMIREVIENGKALEKFREMMVQQGVDPVVAKTLCYDDYRSILPVASKTTDILATKSGWVTGMNSLTIAKVLRDLGAGRRSPQDKLDLAAGMVLLAERGDSVQEGTPWLRVHHNVDLTEQQKSELGGALVVSKERSLTSTSRILLTI
uniref:Thymidine phosphorylase n=1 Tax=Lygus hesperus TaxID=30085 RepID=A0A0A9XVM4_LYGHE